MVSRGSNLKGMSYADERNTENDMGRRTGLVHKIT
jgi:hypothetical protein